MLKKIKTGHPFGCPVVREVGVEPTRPCEHWHLKPASLPIPPLAHLAVERCCSAQDVYYHRAPGMSTDFLRKNEKIFILSNQAKNHSPQRFALWGVCIKGEGDQPTNSASLEVSRPSQVSRKRANSLAMVSTPPGTSDSMFRGSRGSWRDRRSRNQPQP